MSGLEIMRKQLTKQIPIQQVIYLNISILGASLFNAYIKAKFREWHCVKSKTMTLQI